MAGHFLGIRLAVKVGEHEEEHDRMEEVDVQENRISTGAALHQNFERVQEHDHKLGQLNGRYVSLEEQVLLKLWTQRGEAVIGVHDRVHAGVQEREETVVSA